MVDRILGENNLTDWETILGDDEAYKESLRFYMVGAKGDVGGAELAMRTAMSADTVPTFKNPVTKSDRLSR